LDENFSRLITTFDEVPRLCVRRRKRDSRRSCSHAKVLT